MSWIFSVNYHPPQFCLKKNHELISEFFESVLFEKEPRIDLVRSWISFALKRTTNWSRNCLNQFCFKKSHELISEFLESVLFEKKPRIDLGISWIIKTTTNWSRNFFNQFCFEKNHELISELLSLNYQVKIRCFRPEHG